MPCFNFESGNGQNIENMLRTSLPAVAVFRLVLALLPERARTSLKTTAGRLAKNVHKAEIYSRILLAQILHKKECSVSPQN